MNFETFPERNITQHYYSRGIHREIHSQKGRSSSRLSLSLSTFLWPEVLLTEMWHNTVLAYALQIRARWWQDKRTRGIQSRKIAEGSLRAGNEEGRENEHDELQPAENKRQTIISGTVVPGGKNKENKYDRPAWHGFRQEARTTTKQNGTEQTKGRN